jgi:hypothetical protein
MNDKKWVWTGQEDIMEKFGVQYLPNFDKNLDYIFEKIYKELELITGCPIKNTMSDTSNSGGEVRKMKIEENLDNIFKILNNYRQDLTIDEQLPPKIGDK